MADDQYLEEDDEAEHDSEDNVICKCIRFLKSALGFGKLVPLEIVSVCIYLLLYSRIINFILLNRLKSISPAIKSL